MEMSAGQAVERMAGDTFLIQDAIGEKVLYIYIYALRLYIMQEVSCKQINLIPTGLIIWTLCTTTILVTSEDCIQNSIWVLFDAIFFSKTFSVKFSLGWEGHTTPFYFHWWIHHCIHERMAPGPCHAFKRPSDCHCRCNCFKVDDRALHPNASKLQ
jgi:hypothetical protein